MFMKMETPSLHFPGEARRGASTRPPRKGVNKELPELVPRGAAVRPGDLRNALALVAKPPGASAAALCERLQAATALKARCPGDSWTGLVLGLGLW